MVIVMGKEVEEVQRGIVDSGRRVMTSRVSIAVAKNATTFPFIVYHRVGLLLVVEWTRWPFNLCHSRCPFWPTNSLFVISAELSSLDPPPLLSLQDPILVHLNYCPIFKKKITCVSILLKRYDRTWRRSCSSRFTFECWRVRSRRSNYLPSQ